MGKKGGRKGGVDWDAAGAWKPVAIGDEFLVGNGEFGFMGLETIDYTDLDPSTQRMLRASRPVAAEDAEGEGAADDQFEGREVDADLALEVAELDQAKQERKEAKAKKLERAEKKKAKEAKAAAPSDPPAEAPGDVAALRLRLAQLEAENLALKGGAKRKPEDAIAAPAAKKAKKAKKAKAKGKGAGEAEAMGEAPDEAAAPLVDVSAWRPFALHPRLEGALAALGLAAPTPIQRECLPRAIRDQADVIGAAETGSGKTLAFGLPILQRLMHEREARAAEGGTAPPPAEDACLRALILCPTRELALQVADHLKALGQRCGIRAVPIVGGIAQPKQQRLLGYAPEIVVATPGRLWELMSAGEPHLARLDRLSFLVLDEADRMTEQGHFQEMAMILERIPAMARPTAAKQGNARGKAGRRPPPEGEGEGEEPGLGALEGGAEVAYATGGAAGDPNARGRRAVPLQTFVFSATLTLPERLRKRFRVGQGGYGGRSQTLEQLMDKIAFRGEPAIVDLTGARRGVAEKVHESFVTCLDEDRDAVLYLLLTQHPGKAIVFCNAISSVRRLAALARLLGLPVHPIHAQQQQRQRLKSLDRFKADENGVLIATDVAARGLDIPQVKTVVHFQLPASADIYVHRSGRTGRAGREGVAIALVAPSERARFVALLRSLEREEPPPFPLDPSLLAPARERTALAVRLDALERREHKDAADVDWYRRHGDMVGVGVAGAEDVEDVQKRLRHRTRGDRGPSEEQQAAQLRGELARLLAAPLAPRMSARFFTGGAVGLGHIATGGPPTGQEPGESGGGDDDDDDVLGRMQAAAVPKALALAGRLRDASQRAEANVAEQRAQAKKKKARQAKRAAGGDVRQAALAKALRQAGSRKGGRRLVVVPSALGRASEGPGTLEVLQRQMADRALRG